MNETQKPASTVLPNDGAVREESRREPASPVEVEQDGSGEDAGDKLSLDLNQDYPVWPRFAWEDIFRDLRLRYYYPVRKFFRDLWKLTLWHFWNWYIKRARVEPNAKCPSCGAREKHEIRFEYNFLWPDGSKGAIIHTCNIDKAMWAEKPIVKAERWHIEGIVLNDEDVRADTPIINKPAAVSQSEAKERKRSVPSFKLR